MNLGNYQTTRLLGKGGFATVYLGEHTRLHRQVAIKLLKAHLSEQEQQSFFTEAHTLAQLHHPNIVQVLDFGITDGTPYLVMKYLAYGTLRQYYQKGQPYPLVSCLSHLKQVAEALQYAHDRKIIHRDVKPENMLLGDNGEAILTDFGIAVLNQESRQHNKQDVVGTAPYMAPEQIKGFPRRASDQYALAVVAYEWLCGERPFTGDRFEQIVFQHIHTQPPSLRIKQPELTQQIEAVVLKALAKDPEARYATILEFARALEQNSQGSQNVTLSNAITAELPPEKTPSLTPTIPAIPPITPISTRKLITDKIATYPPARRRSLLLAGGLAALLTIGGSVTWWTHVLSTHTTAQTSPSTSQTPQMLAATTIYRPVGAAADSVSWAPDNKRLVSGTGDKSHTVQIWGGTKTIALPYSGPVSWSPDGHFIAACDRNFLHLWDTTTNQEKSSLAMLPSLPAGTPDLGSGPTIIIAHAISWSPNSSHVISGLELPNSLTQDGQDTGYLYLWPQGSIVTNTPYSVGIVVLAWSKDNTHVVYGTTDGNVYLHNLATGQSLLYQSHFDRIFSLVWSADEKSILIAGDGWPTQLVDANTLQTKDSTFLSDYTTPLDWAPNGSLIASTYARQNDYRVWIWQAASGKPVFLCQGHTDKINALTWSPNGHWLASASADGTIRLWAIPQ